MQRDDGSNSKFKKGITIWAVLTSIAIFWGFHDLRAQTNNIQKSRVESCQRGYDGTRLLFKPFFPADPNKYTPQQKKFNARVDLLKRRCPKQVGIPTNP